MSIPDTISIKNGRTKVLLDAIRRSIGETSLTRTVAIVVDVEYRRMVRDGIITIDPRSVPFTAAPSIPTLNPPTPSNLKITDGNTTDTVGDLT